MLNRKFYFCLAFLGVFFSCGAAILAADDTDIEQENEVEDTGLSEPLGPAVLTTSSLTKKFEDLASKTASSGQSPSSARSSKGWYWYLKGRGKSSSNAAARKTSEKPKKESKQTEPAAPPAETKSPAAARAPDALPDESKEETSDLGKIY